MPDAYITRYASSITRLRGHLRALALVLLAQLGRELSAEVIGLEHLANLDLRLPGHRVGAALDPFDRLFLGTDLPDPVAGDQLLRLGERTVDHGSFLTRELDSRALRAGMQPLARDHHAGLDQLIIEIAHRGEQLLIRHHAG